MLVCHCSQTLLCTQHPKWCQDMSDLTTNSDGKVHHLDDLHTQLNKGICSHLHYQWDSEEILCRFRRSVSKWCSFINIAGVFPDHYKSIGWRDDDKGHTRRHIKTIPAWCPRGFLLLLPLLLFSPSPPPLGLPPGSRPLPEVPVATPAQRGIRAAAAASPPANIRESLLLPLLPVCPEAIPVGGGHDVFDKPALTPGSPYAKSSCDLCLGPTRRVAPSRCRTLAAEASVPPLKNP